MAEKQQTRDLKRKRLFGITFVDETEQGLVEYLIGNSGNRYNIVTFSLPLAGPFESDPGFRKVVMDANVVLPDGKTVVWASRLFKGKRINERLTGPGIFMELLKSASQNSLRVFFLGSTEKVLDLIRKRISAEFPGVILSGMISPPFGEWSAAENERICSEISSSRPDILFVGLTAPRQEIWLNDNRDKIPVRIAAAVGAAFDFFAGTSKRAPRWMQQAGLEWLHRTSREPFRMGRRYLRGIFPFAKLILKEMFNKKTG